MVDNGFRVMIAIILKEVGNVILPDIGAWEEVLLILMLFQNFKQVLCGFQTCKDLSLADHDVFLKIVGSLLGNTKIFHLRRHLDFQFLADMKEMIDGITAGEDDGRMIEDLYLLFSKLFYRYRFNLMNGRKKLDRFPITS